MGVRFVLDQSVNRPMQILPFVAGLRAANAASSTLDSYHW
jgi:hypothetical protein